MTSPHFLLRIKEARTQSEAGGGEGVKESTAFSGSRNCLPHVCAHTTQGQCSLNLLAHICSRLVAPMKCFHHHWQPVSCSAPSVAWFHLAPREITRLRPAFHPHLHRQQSGTASKECTTSRANAAYQVHQSPCKQFN